MGTKIKEHIKTIGLFILGVIGLIIWFDFITTIFPFVYETPHSEVLFDTETLKKYSDVIFDKLEGGYYNPKKHNSTKMGKSGETMYGIDRACGGNDVITGYGEKFWKIIDHNSQDWDYNSDGGKNKAELRYLAAQMMYDRYKEYSDNFLTIRAKTYINKSANLQFHFYYACWNGCGWFEYFAKDFNKQVLKTKNISKLENSCITIRKNSTFETISKGGEIMENIFDDKILATEPNVSFWDKLFNRNLNYSELIREFERENNFVFTDFRKKLILQQTEDNPSKRQFKKILQENAEIQNNVWKQKNM